MTWTEARDYCQSINADLAIIEDRAEHNAILEFTRQDIYWIGGQDSVVENVWMWIGNIVVGFNGKYHCLYMIPRHPMGCIHDLLDIPDTLYSATHVSLERVLYLEKVRLVISDHGNEVLGLPESVTIEIRYP